MNVKLPSTTNPFLRHLIVKLVEIFRKVRPASGWKDKEAPLASGKLPAANAPTWSTFRDGIGAYEFSASATNSIYITFHLPHDMALSYVKEDGTVTSPKLFPHVHYASNAATPSVGTVRWGFEWTYANGYGTEAFGASTTTYLEHTPTGTQYLHEIAEVTDANAIQDDFETDGLILMRFFRDGSHANDTNADALHVFTIDIHYYSDGLETNERNRNSASGQLPWTKQNPI